jgi:two-component system chemotaxis response regulator CheY
MRILIVEDDYDVRRLLKKNLAGYGDCDMAVTGIEALESFNDALDDSSPYDLICLDFMIPNTDGEEVLKEVRRVEKEKGIDSASEVKIIVISAVHEPAVVSDAVEKWGASSYIIKPFRKEMLIDEMRKLGLIE